MKVVYTFQARQDLKNIYAYITYTPLAPEAAEKLMNEIIQNVNTLDSMPERNPLYRDEPWHSRGVRYLPVRKYLVFYTVANGGFADAERRHFWNRLDGDRDGTKAA